MKIVLKVLALPLLFIVTIAYILGNLITNISSYVIALLLLVIAGCSIYCIVKALWTSLAILAGMGLAAILIIFLLVWAVVKLETLGNHINVSCCQFEPLVSNRSPHQTQCRCADQYRKDSSRRNAQAFSLMDSNPFWFCCHYCINYSVPFAFAPRQDNVSKKFGLMKNIIHQFN